MNHMGQIHSRRISYDIHCSWEKSSNQRRNNKFTNHMGLISSRRKCCMISIIAGRKAATTQELSIHESYGTNSYQNKMPCDIHYNWKKRSNQPRNYLFMNQMAPVLSRGKFRMISIITRKKSSNQPRNCQFINHIGQIHSTRKFRMMKYPPITYTLKNIFRQTHK